MKRDVMRLGEDHLLARFTNLKTKQKQEEDMMQQMLLSSEIIVSRPVAPKTQSLIKVSQLWAFNVSIVGWHDGQEENSRGCKVFRRIADWQKDDGIIDDVACR